MGYILKLKKGDFIIILILILAIILYFIFYTDTQIQKKAVIKIDGIIYKEINLQKENTGKEQIIFDNDGYMNLVYNEGGIYIEDVTCPDKICYKTGNITKANQTIVCLPNKTIISIENITNSTEIDNLTY